MAPTLRMRLERLYAIFIAVIAYVAILYPLTATAQACDKVDELVTATPAPPSSAVAWRTYLEETHFAVRADVDLVLIGDSLAKNWDPKMLLPMRVLNLGIWGDKTQNVLWRLAFPKWSNIRPRKVLIILGTNNLKDRPCAIVFGLVKVFKRVASIWPSAQIGYLEIPPRGTHFLDYNDNRMRINAAIRKVPGIKSISVDNEITCEWQEPCSNYLVDNLHFSEAAYRVILTSVERVLFKK
jgi:lysophospholipase L1-like esterase